MVAEDSRDESGTVIVPIGQRFWNVNVPEDSWTEQCPEFLVKQGEKNIKILSTRDEDYINLTWPEVQHVIGENDNPRQPRYTSYEDGEQTRANDC